MVKLGKKWLTKRPDELRYEARMVYLDGKLARARALNRLADKLARSPKPTESDNEPT